MFSSHFLVLDNSMDVINRIKQENVYRGYRRIISINIGICPCICLCVSCRLVFESVIKIKYSSKVSPKGNYFYAEKIGLELLEYFIVVFIFACYILIMQINWGFRSSRESFKNSLIAFVPYLQYDYVSEQHRWTNM